MNLYTVVNATPRTHKKQIVVLDGERKQVALQVGRFACVGKGDQVALDVEHPANVFVASSENRDDYIRISPAFERNEQVSVGATKFPLRVTEISRPEDTDALSFLEQFHYRSTSFEEEEVDLFGARPKSVSTGGRRAVLVLYVKIEGEWCAGGYIELQMPLMMVKPRHELFNNAFNHPERPIHWSVWDQHAMKKYLNLIVRVSRVVVSPDFRGLGLSRTLLRSAQEFCRTRWHLGGHRPIFLEISAEMLNYIDFVSSCDFRYVAHTEGNAERVVKDLSHMANGYEVTSGIMSLQKKYLTTIERYAEATGKTFAEILQRLSEILRSKDPAGSLTPAEWAAFRSVIRMPRPYYLSPLDPHAAEYLRRHLADRKPPRTKPVFAVRAPELKIDRLSIRSSIEIRQTPNVRIIMDSFGLHGDKLFSQILPPTSIRATGGNIIMVVGPSGSGKSVLLRALDPGASGHDPSFEVQVSGARDYSAGWIRQLPADVPIFDYFASRYSPERAFAALSQAGLSEAFALIKPFGLLSRGQQYRAMLADLVLREDQIWLLDEFCADLDPLTAKIVAHNFRRHVIASGRIAVVAAANHGHYLDALRPNRVIRLKTGAIPQMISYKEYRDGVLDEAV